MAIAVLSVRQRGSTQFSAVFRMAGITATQVGNNFSIITLTAATGTANPGDTLTGGTSGATAKVTQVLQSGATTKVVVNTVTGVFTNENVTTTAGTGTLAGTLSTANIGILENGGDANKNIYQDRVLSYKGSLYCALNNYILKYDGTTNWSVVHTYATPLSSSELNCHGGLHVFYVNNHPLLGVIWGGASGNNAVYRATSPDGTTWTEATLASGKGMNATSWAGVLREVVYNNILYWTANWNNGQGTAHTQWDPSNDAFQQINVGASGMAHVPANDLYVFQNQLLQIAENGGNGHLALYSFLAGAWVQVLDIAATGNILGGGSGTQTTQWTMWDPGDGFLYIVYYAFTNPNVGWVVKQITFSGGIFTDPGAANGIGGTVLAGTGINLYPGGPSGEGGRWYVVVDDVTTPGTPVTYLYFAANDTPGTPVTVMQWNGPGSAVTNLGTGGDIANALAHTRQGGGERIWGPGQPDIIITDIQSVAGGERLFFIGYGGGTKSVNFWFGQTGEEPKTQSTLAGPVVGGGVLAGNQVNSVPMDGVTVNQVTWNAGPSGDNVVNLTRAQLQAVAF